MTTLHPLAPEPAGVMARATNSNRPGHGSKRDGTATDLPEIAAATLAAELNYGEAHAALELALAELQSPDLAVEAMTALYARAQAYAARCEQLLEAVEQQVELWDPQQGKIAPLDTP